MSHTDSPFRLPLKPQVGSLPDGRFRVYVGGAYQDMTEGELMALARQIEAALTAEESA